MEEYRDETKDMEEKEEREDIREYVERKRLLFFGLPFTERPLSPQQSWGE